MEESLGTSSCSAQRGLEKLCVARPAADATLRASRSPPPLPLPPHTPALLPLPSRSPSRFPLPLRLPAPASRSGFPLRFPLRLPARPSRSARRSPLAARRSPLSAARSQHSPPLPPAPSPSPPYSLPLSPSPSLPLSLSPPLFLSPSPPSPSSLSLVPECHTRARTERTRAVGQGNRVTGCAQLSSSKRPPTSPTNLPSSLR